MSFEEKYYEAPEFWSEGVLTTRHNLIRIRETIDLVPGDVRSLLDVGCGNGVFANELSEARPEIRVSATDRSREAIRHVNTDKFEANMCSIPRADKSFDCVTCLQVIEHLPQGQYQQALSELARLARRYIIIGVPYDENLLKDFTRCPACLSQFNVNLHLRTYKIDMIRSLFANADFECSVVRHIDNVRRFYGQPLYAKLKAAFSGRTRQEFGSPICPVCGYERQNFIAPATSAEADDARADGRSLKSLIKAVWPSFEAPGYWIAARYERRNA